MILTLLLALSTGFLFSLNAFSLYYCITKLDYPVVQLNFDGSILFGLILLPIFLNDWVNNNDEKTKFTSDDILYSNLSQFLTIIGVIAFGYAL